jgi:hypothetical protein
MACFLLVVKQVYARGLPYSMKPKGRRATALLLFASAFTFIVCLRAQETSRNKVDPFQTAPVLKSGREYCRRLEKAALDFVCREEVQEELDLSRDAKADGGGQMLSFDPGYAGGYGRTGTRIPTVLRDVGRSASMANSYVFDYQFLRQGGQVTEKRVLLEKNHKKAREKEAPPETSTFHYADILLAPVRLLDERFGEYYEYRLLREDTLDGVKAWVLDVIPRLAIVDAYLGGKIWLKEADSSVLRIDWDPSTFGRYENILRRAKAFQAQPLVTSTTEFGMEKNGIRFPSVDLTEEAYQDQKGGKFVRAVTKVVYKDYKFFTVETETAFKR